MLAAGVSIVKIDYTPYMVRAFLPIIKRLISKNNSSENFNKACILESPLYRGYIRYVYPLEYAIGFFFKGLLAFRIIVVGKK